MRRPVLALAILFLVAGCGLFEDDKPVVRPPPYDFPVNPNPPVQDRMAVVENPRRITGVPPCSVVTALDVEHWVGKGRASATKSICEVSGHRGRVRILLGDKDTVYAASQIPIGDLGRQGLVRGNTAWIEPRKKGSKCLVFVAVSVSPAVSALQVESAFGMDCGLAQEVAATVVDRLPPGPDPDERFDRLLHPTPTVAATPTR